MQLVQIILVAHSDQSTLFWTNLTRLYGFVYLTALIIENPLYLSSFETLRTAAPEFHPSRNIEPYEIKNHIVLFKIVPIAMAKIKLFTNYIIIHCTYQIIFSNFFL